MNLKPRDRAEVYDKLYALAAKILDKSRACSTCPIGSCTKFLGRFTETYTKSWCCYGCPHLGDNGCTVQALGCKLWLCTKEMGSLPFRWEKKIAKLEEIAKYYGIHMARADKQQSLQYGQHKPFWFIYERDSQK